MITTQLNEGMTTEGPVAERRRQYMRECWQRLEGLRVPLVVEAGRSELAPQDIEDLEIGDIILLEDSNLTLEGDQLSGRVPAYVGEGLRGKMLCQPATFWVSLIPLLLLAEINEESVVKARDEAQQIVNSARDEVNAELNRARQTLRAEVAGIALMAAEQVIESELDASRHTKLVEGIVSKGFGNA